MAQLHVRTRENHGLSTQLAHTHIKTDPCTSRGFFENQRNHVTRQRLFGVHRALGLTLTCIFHFARVINDFAQLFRCNFVDI